MQIEFIGSLLLIFIFFFAKKLTRREQGALNVAAMAAVIIVILEWQSNLSLFACGLILYRLFYGSFQPKLWKEIVATPIFLIGIYFGCLPMAPQRDRLQNTLLMWSGESFEQFADHTVLYPLLNLYGIKQWVPFPFLPEAVYHSLGAIMLISAVLMSTKLREMFETPACAFLGAISFSLYLTHSLIRELVCKATNDSLLELGFNSTDSLIISTLAFIFFAILLATAFYQIIERRSIRLSERIVYWLFLNSPPAPSGA
jgi:peptidoglycan/LPS O-acetylase OafA/YrhL